MRDLFGFYIGLHDSNVAAIKDGKLHYRKFERRSGVKHERVDIAKVEATIQEWGLNDPLIAFSDGNRNNLGVCSGDQIYTQLTDGTWVVDHHYAHALSGWVNNPGRGRYVSVVVDGKGDSGFRAKVIEVQEQGVDANVKWQSKAYTLGKFFTEVGYAMHLGGAEVDFAGKVMGLQAYGNVQNDLLNQLAGLPHLSIPGVLPRMAYRGKRPLSDPGFANPGNQDFRDWLTTCHDALGKSLLFLFRAFADRGEEVEFTGGCAQNSVYNEMLAGEYPRLTIPPHCYDGGLSLGCVEFLRRLYDVERPEVNEFPFIQDDEDVGYASEVTQKRVAEMIADGKIVAWMQGRGEVGPRALGHRSILFDPRRTDAKQILNERVKFRESWRPFAASVLVDSAPEWFNTDSTSPYMQRALETTGRCRFAAPGVVHADGTCRAQTVGYGRRLETFYGLIDFFQDLTGVPLVINTSLNTGGEPIHGTAGQAERLLGHGRVDALCVGDTLH